MFKRSEGTNDLSELEKKKIEIEAREYSQEVRKRLGILENDYVDVIPLLERQGILVFQIIDLSTSGFIRVLEGKNTVFLNASEPLGRQYYTAVHEYCHILRDLDKIKEIEDYSVEQKTIEFKKMEYFAFKFADYFLIPERALISHLHITNIKDFSTIEVEEVLGIQEYFKLSYRQVTRMLNKYDIISASKRDELNKISSKEHPNQLLDAIINAGYDPSLIL
ncbi:ImmA/IrrE family metallo-endopeptidase, partial [Shigella flexneri]|nr:ImmA/IrrE family metallo-endopeptidase [Shigella flexneri]